MWFIFGRYGRVLPGTGSVFGDAERPEACDPNKAKQPLGVLPVRRSPGFVDISKQSWRQFESSQILLYVSDDVGLQYTLFYVPNIYIPERGPKFVTLQHLCRRRVDSKITSIDHYLLPVCICRRRKINHGPTNLRSPIKTRQCQS